MGTITPGSGMAKASARSRFDAQVSKLILSISRAWRTSRWEVISSTGIGLSLLFFILDLPYFLKVNPRNVALTVSQHLFVLAWLLIVTARSRTVRFRTLLAFWLIGVYSVFGLIEMAGQSVAGHFGVNSFINMSVQEPLSNELLKALPVFLYLFLMARRDLWQPSATDGLLLGFAVATGVLFHEDAMYGRVWGSGWEAGGLNFLLPVVDQSGGIVSGYPTANLLVGLALGLAILYRGRRLIWLLPVAAIVLWMLVHGIFNAPIPAAAELRWLMLIGQLPVFALLVGLLVTIVLELRILSWAASKDPDHPPISFKEIRSRLKLPVTWEWLLWLQAVDDYHRLRRGLHFAMWRWAHLQPAPPAEVQEAMARVVSRRRLAVALLSDRMEKEQRRLPIASTSLLLLGAGVVLIPWLAVFLQRTWAGGLLCVSCKCFGSFCLPPLTAFGKGLPSVAGGTPLPTHPRTHKKRKAPTPKKKEKKPDPCAGYQRGYDQEKALLDTIDAQQKSKKHEFEKRLPKYNQLLDEFNKVAPKAEDTLRHMRELAVAEATVKFIGELGIFEAEVGLNPVEGWHIFEYATELSELLHSASGTLEELKDWVIHNPDAGTIFDVAPVLEMINVKEQMQELVDQMIVLRNQYDQMQPEKDAQAQKVADAKAALDACRAGQP